MMEPGVAVLPGSTFGTAGEGYVRIACTQSQETLMAAMDRMERFMQNRL